MQAIETKLDELRPQLQAAENAEQRARDALEDAAIQVRTLKKMIAMLEELRSLPSEIQATQRPRKPKPSQAIRMLIAQRPGISMKEILDTLEGKIETSSADARHLLRTTLNNLVREGKVIRHSDDLYSVPNHR